MLLMLVRLGMEMGMLMLGRGRLGKPAEVDMGWRFVGMLLRETMLMWEADVVGCCWWRLLPELLLLLLPTTIPEPIPPNSPFMFPPPAPSIPMSSPILVGPDP